MLRRPATATNHSSALLGKKSAGCGILFGLFFVGMGATFIAVIVATLSKEVKPYLWEEVPCQVTLCDIEVNESDRDPFTLKVRYEYRWDGASHVSDQYAVSDRKESDYEKLALERERLLKGRAEVFCYVDPENPKMAVLKRGDIWIGVFAIIPMIFVGVGLIIVFASISLARKPKASGEKENSAVPLSSLKRKSGIGLVLFGLVFLTVGVACFAVMVIVPLKRYFDSEEWVETECKIVWSKVREHRGDDSTTYSIDILYEYEWQGELQRSNRFSVTSGGSSSGRSGKRKIVKQYPKGSQHSCRVNPDIPQQALLERDLSGIWFGLLPLVFVAAGAGVIVGGYRTMQKRRTQPPQKAWAGKIPRRERYVRGRAAHNIKSAVRPDGSVEFRSGKSRWTTVLATVIFGLVWNGLVGAFVYQLVLGWMRGRGEWIPTLFMVPFVIVGLLIVGFFIYSLLQAFNPQVVVTLVADRVRLGETLRIHWKSSGSMRRLRSLRILVRGTEKATYRRGTNTVTDDSVFFQREFMQTAQPLEMMNGSGDVNIPEDLMFSFDCGNNRIDWEIAIEGDIPNWPDISDEYSIEMLQPDRNR